MKNAVKARRCAFDKLRHRDGFAVTEPVEVPHKLQTPHSKLIINQ